MGLQKITYQYADTGHWLARCNHTTGVIELNSREFNSLSPLMKDYIWVHECVHLLSEVRNESETNRISDEIFVSRARNERDRKRREEFIAAANDHSFTRVTRPTLGATSVVLAVLAVTIFLNLKNRIL